MGLSLATAAVAWYLWPRIEHARQMQNPLAAQRVRQESQEWALQIEREKLNLEIAAEEHAARIERVRAETKQIESVVRLGKGEAAFTVEGEFYASASDAKLLNAPEVVPAAGDPMPILLESLHLMVIGSTNGGKTTLIHHMATTWAAFGQRVIVLDFDYANGMWPGCDILTENDVEEFCRTLLDEFSSRKLQRASGERTSFAGWRIVIDEYSAVAADKKVSSVVELLIRRGRKYNMKVCVGIQDNQVKSLGWEGKGALRTNFSYTVEARFDASKQQRTLLMTPPNGESAAYLTPVLQSPESFVQAVQATSEAGSEPFAESFMEVHERFVKQYEGREKEMAVLVVKGWPKTKARESVTGGAAMLGEMYDKIKAELEAFEAKQKQEAKLKQIPAVWATMPGTEERSNGGLH